MKEKKLFNRTEAADYLGIDRHTLINWEKKKFGPLPIPGGRPLYSRIVIDRFLAA